jgi:DNA-binding NarL/FixJ family response regulator
VKRSSEISDKNRHRALVVDDHPAMLDAVSAWLRRGSSMIGEVDTAATLREAREMLTRRQDYSIVILDLNLSDARQLEGLASLRETFPDVPVLVHSGDDDIVTIHGALEKGAQGYVVKNCRQHEFQKCVEEVLAGRMSVPANALLTYGALTTAPPLSPRETEVLRLLLKGMPNKVIGAHLGMAEGTVKTHLHSVFRQLRVRNRAEAILAAIKLGMK